MFEIEVTAKPEALLADTSAWDSLSRGVPFRESSWLGPWWTRLGGENEAYLIVARDGDRRVRGLLPLYRRSATGNDRTLGIMGDGDACSDHVSVLAHDSDVADVAKSIGQFLASHSASPSLGWDLLDMDGVVEGDVGMMALMCELQSAQATIHATSRMSTWIKPADESWDAHLKHFSKTERRKHRRMREKIGPDGLFQHHLPQTEEEVRVLVGQLIEMHQQRWTEVGESGSYADSSFRDFIHDSAQRFHQCGRLHLNSLAYEGKTAAAELNLVGTDGMIYSFSSGFDTDQAELEAGRYLRVQTLCYLYENSLKGIDFMRGDEVYKQRCTTESRRVMRLRVAAPTIVPRLRHAAWCTGFEFKQWMRRKTGRQPVVVLDVTAAPGVVAGSPAVN